MARMNLSSASNFYRQHFCLQIEIYFKVSGLWNDTNGMFIRKAKFLKTHDKNGGGGGTFNTTKVKYNIQIWHNLILIHIA